MLHLVRHGPPLIEPSRPAHEWPLDPARYDDVLTLRTTVTRTTPVRIEHRYELLRDGQVLADGSSTLACVDREGRLQAMPEWLQKSD